MRKLVPNLMDKTKYVLHYRDLQQYLDLGLKTKKVCRVLRFMEYPLLKQYFNTQRRTAANNAFEKDLFKLMNNSVFGKTIGKIRKRSDVRTVQLRKSSYYSVSLG